MRFAEGRTVLYRNTRHGRVVNVRPGRVVSDDDRGLLLWLPHGAAMAVDVAEDGRGIRSMPFTEWVGLRWHLVPATWQGPGILKFLPPDVEHSVWFFFDEDGTFANWYVNLEEHAVRWDDGGDDAGGAAGIDVVDQDLDVVAYPDHTWQWKDEDEFAERLALPEHYWVPDEAAVRAEGLRVVKLIEAAEFPFDGTWTDFRPDPTWPVPSQLPKGWDRPVARSG
jgi:hypothetical protein